MQKIIMSVKKLCINVSNDTSYIYATTTKLRCITSQVLYFDKLVLKKFGSKCEKKLAEAHKMLKISFLAIT